MIECRQLVKTYQSGDQMTPVLKNVSFTIKTGEFVAIMGPSGSGKSTLMHILGALDTPTTGTYVLDGQDVSAMSDEELASLRKKRIGFVFQAFNLLPRASVLRNVALPLVYAEMEKSSRETAAHKALRAVGLSNQLSGGQMQRVAIARALVNDPAIILADEPTGNLDTKTGEVVLKTFEDLNTSGRTIILITHERAVAEHAHRIIQLRDGAIISDAAVVTPRSRI